MHFGDRPVMCGLEVAKRKVTTLGHDIDLEASLMITKGYVDDGFRDGEKVDMDRLVSDESWD